MARSAIVVASRFRGPPASGNGGYVAGLLGSRMRGTARVRLHAPPPLDRELAIETNGEGRITDEGAMVASASPASIAESPPAPPSLDDAREASRRYRGFDRHPFPTCFVCGPERAEGDGLRIFAGPVSPGLVAAPFVPPRDLVRPDGTLPPEIVWAALDCPGYFAIVADDVVPMVLGEIAVEIRGPAGPGPLVAYGWSLGAEGRKARCGTALATPEGQVVAVGVATWIRPKGT